jgi:hypothetical protein
MDEKQPLAYYAPGDGADDGEQEQSRQGELRLHFAVLAIGCCMLLSVFVIPPVRSWVVSAMRPAPPRPPAPAYRTDTAAGSVSILMALEAYREQKGGYPASLRELPPDASGGRFDPAAWRYARDRDGADYELHYVGDARGGGDPSPSR